MVYYFKWLSSAAFFCISIYFVLKWKLIISCFVLQEGPHPLCGWHRCTGLLFLHHRSLAFSRLPASLPPKEATGPLSPQACADCWFLEGFSVSLGPLIKCKLLCREFLVEADGPFLLDVRISWKAAGSWADGDRTWGLGKEKETEQGGENTLSLPHIFLEEENCHPLSLKASGRPEQSAPLAAAAPWSDLIGGAGYLFHRLPGTLCTFFPWSGSSL